MLCQFSAWGIPLIVLLCRVGVSDAVPFGPHPADEVGPRPSSQSKSSESVRKTSPVTEQPPSISSTNSSLGSTNTERPNSNFSNGTNVNAVQSDSLNPTVNNVQSDEKQPTRDSSEDDSETESSEKSNNSNDSSSTADSVPKLDAQKSPKSENESVEKCTNEARRKNETYTRSIPLNISSVDPDEDFKIAGEAEAKKVSSVNVGEDIALCWIETTTIKEDPAFDPPKRLVIREFTISFENSATVPDNYLECDRLDGEIEPGDEETVRKSSLHEVIDENTKRSREVNFTSVSHVGNLVVRQHRKIRCSVGAVVSKDIYEWPDGTDNPKKRVEIKVGPSVRDLGVRTPEESGDCTTEDLPDKRKADGSGSSSTDCTSSVSCEASCEDGQDCDKSRTASACEENDCSSARDSSEETTPTTYRPDSNELLPAGLTTSSPVKKPDEDRTLKNSSTPNRLDRYSDEVCDEYDTECTSGTTTGLSITDTEEMTGGKTAGGTSTEDTGESCQEGSEDCSCSESSCSTDRSDKSRNLEIGNKRTELPTISSSTKGPNETLTDSATKTTVPLNGTECDGGSGECSTSSESSSEEVAGTKAGTAPGRNASENGHTGSPLSTDSELAETIGGTAVPGDTNFSHEELRDANSLNTESTEPSFPKKEDSAPSNSRTNDSEESCDESSNDEDCTSMDSSNEDPVSKSDSITTASPTEESKKLPNSVTSEEPEGGTNNQSDRYTSMPSNQTDERTSTIESTTRLPKEQSTDCSASSESGDCSTVTASPLMQNKTIALSNQEDSTSSTQSCESSGSCGSTQTDLDSLETSQASMNPAASVKTPDGSICNESSESCESSSSSNDSYTESCEDGSPSGDCTSERDSLTSVSCDPASGSCSSESNDPTSVVVETTTSTSEATSEESENSSTMVDNVLTTLATRRSTVPTLFLTPQPSKAPHKLALRIKVLLERINDNKEKEKLVHVEKNLLINENPNERGNQSLVWKLKSLNDTINVETLRAIFNCSAFAKLSEGVTNLTESGQDKEAKTSAAEKSVNTSIDESIEETVKEGDDYESNESTDSSPRKKREAGILDEHVANNTNTTDATKAKAIRESIPGVEEDLKKGMDHVLSRISKELDSSANSGSGKAVESSSSGILKILASPIEGRVHSRRRRGVKKVGAVMVVEPLKNPVKGEEIDTWSNERIISAPDGGNVRSVMEFKLLRDAVETTPKAPLGP